MSNEVFGCLERTTKVGDGSFPVFDEDVVPLIPEPKWQDTEQLKPFNWRQIDQSNQSSCAGAAGCHALQIAREVAELPRVALSQAVPYALCNGGLDSGASIDSILTALTDIGTTSVSVIDQYDWQGYRRGLWPDDWKERAKPFRIDEAWDAPSYDHFMSGIQRGFTGILGVFWGYPRRTGGHALCVTGAKDGRLEILHSWKGRSYEVLNRRQCAQGIEYFGGWLIRSVVQPEGGMIK